MSRTTPKINKSTTSKYQGSYPQLFLEMCAIGKGTIEFCAKVGICRDTFDNWCKTYPDMLEAKKRGKLLAETWWRTEAQAHLVTLSDKFQNVSFDTNLYKFTMGGRFGYSSKKRFKMPEMDEDILGNYLKIIKAASQDYYEPQDIKCAVDVVLAGMTILEHVKIIKELDVIKAHIGLQKQEVEGRADEVDDGA